MNKIRTVGVVLGLGLLVCQGTIYAMEVRRTTFADNKTRIPRLDLAKREAADCRYTAPSDKWRETQLCQACDAGDVEAFIAKAGALKEEGVELSSFDLGRYLQHAVDKGHLELVKELVHKAEHGYGSTSCLKLAQEKAVGDDSGKYAQIAALFEGDADDE